MDTEKLLLELNNQAETIKTHISRLKRNERNIHILDVDMLRNKTIELYEMVSDLEQLVENSSKAKLVKPHKIAPPATVSQLIKPPVIEDIAIDIDTSPEVNKVKIETIPEVEKQEILVEDVTIEQTVISEVIKPAPEKPPVAEPKPKPEPAQTNTPLVAEKIQEPILAKTVVEEKSESVEQEKPLPQQSTYDLFSSNSDNAVAEKYNAKEEQSIADKMQKSHISNIREAIGINEKFLFINELFNGDLGRYNKILDDINDLPTKQGVDTYLFELKIQFQWADDGEAYLKLKELLERKFI